MYRRALRPQVPARRALAIIGGLLGCVVVICVVVASRAQGLAAILAGLAASIAYQRARAASKRQRTAAWPYLVECLVVAVVTAIVFEAAIVLVGWHPGMVGLIGVTLIGTLDALDRWSYMQPASSVRSPFRQRRH
jgi:hypothetical protein